MLIPSVSSEDIDECLDPDSFSCPGQFRVCANVPGNYTCECQNGLLFINNTCQGEKKNIILSNSFNYVVIHSDQTTNKPIRTCITVYCVSQNTDASDKPIETNEKCN